MLSLLHFSFLESENTIFEREDQFLLEKVYEIVLYYIAFVCIWTRDWIAF